MTTAPVAAATTKVAVGDKTTTPIKIKTTIWGAGHTKRLAPQNFNNVKLPYDGAIGRAKLRFATKTITTDSADA